jgi:hypothetical protein
MPGIFDDERPGSGPMASGHALVLTMVPKTRSVTVLPEVAKMVL